MPMRSQYAAFTTMNAASTTMPTAARRIVGTRAVTRLVIRRPSIRAWGTNSSATRSSTVGITKNGSPQLTPSVVPPPQSRKFDWNAMNSPMAMPPA